jgi:hypothetical protein
MLIQVTDSRIVFCNWGGTAVLAPKFAKPQTKAAEGSTSKLARRRSTALPETERNNDPAMTGVSTSGQEAPRGVSFSFSRISVLPPDLFFGVDEPLEREADHIAERVMRMPGTTLAALPLTHAVSSLQRKCSCGGSCDKCKAEQPGNEQEHVQRKSAAAETSRHTSAPFRTRALINEVLQAAGQPLDSKAREFFEPRFARDFGRVRIHTDARAAESARSVQALAYTVGNRIVFSSGEYAPQTKAGRRLIAHELAHTVQQGARSPRLLQRAVTKNFDKLKDYLTYGLFDWAITDADAHKSLMILKALNPTDLKDTVAAMEKEGWVDRLFSNVSDDDSKRETDLLERINDVRVHKGKKGQADLVGPCNQEQRKQIDDRVASTKDWAREAKNRVNAYAADPARHADTGKLLDTHFFHQKNNGPLAPAQQVTNARRIANNFQTVEVQQNPMPNQCASPFDPLCASLALAYVSTRTNRVVFCSSYFDSKPQRQVYDLLHEFMHEFSGVADRGYGDERIFAYLTPADAMNNADSYALFAVDVNDKEETSADIRPQPRDKVSDCGANESEVRRRFAFAARMITNALNVIGDPHIGGAEAQAHFKTEDRVKLQQVIDRFKKINDQFSGGMNFECEDKCDGETGYWRSWGWTVHLCPAWFKLPTAEERTDDILLIAISEEQGMDYGPAVGTPAYATLSEKKAYDSASAYVGYARAVTKKFFV